MLRLGCLVSGGGTNLQALIDRIEDKTLHGVEIATVISSKPSAYALTRANNHGIDSVCISPKDFDSKAAYEERLINYIDEKQVDLLLLLGFTVIFTEGFIEACKRRIINVHPSLIPSFCGKGFYGLAVHEAALARGVKITGATVHYVDGGTDTGPIILQKAVDVREDDTAETLQRRVMEEAEWVILPEAVGLLAQGEKWRLV